MTVADVVFNYKLRNALTQKIESKRYKNFDNSRLIGFCGIYKITSPLEMAGQKITLSNEKEFLNLQLNNGGPYKVFPQSPDSFFMMSYGGIDFSCSFKMEGDKATRLFLINPGLSVEACRTE